MKPVLSREQMRAFDAAAIQDCSVPSLLLMENAGRGAADIIAAELAARPACRTLVVSGSGNNGGDGFVVARQLLTRGFEVDVVLATRIGALKGDARANADAFLGLRGSVRELTDQSEIGELEASLLRAGCVVDALFGTGLDREITGLHREIIERMNAARHFTCALDIPSGIDSNTGRVLGAAVRADLTVTFAHYKIGLLAGAASDFTGRIEVVSIGVPADLWHRVGSSAELVESSDVRERLVPRARTTHKSSAGRVLVVAGSPGKTGAALLVARGALRAGAGLITIAAHSETVASLEPRVLEEMTARIDPDRMAESLEPLLSSAAAVALGPGIGLDSAAGRLVEHVALSFPGPVVLDADGLSHFARRVEKLHEARGKLILTPHPAEMARLLGISTSDVEADRFGAVARCASASGATVLLKGPHTIVGQSGKVPVVNGSGTPVLATAGSGDILTGITTALACTLEPFEAAYAAAHVHGLAGQAWADAMRADRGLIAHEIADKLPMVFGSLVSSGGACRRHSH